jgi:thiamine-monophosphate kinase
MNGLVTLGDMGERALVRDVLPKYCNPAGDDCASFKSAHHLLVITTDSVPEPAAKILGRDSDLYSMGWLLVTINCSDVAAAGARPAVFVAAIEAPASLLVVDFERLLEGIRDACTEYGAAYVGGNLREAQKLGATGTAVGICTPREAISRRGANVGDIVASVGFGGVFWRDALETRQGRPVQRKNDSPLFRPIAQVRAMADLHELGVITAAIDNSDGLLPSLEQLAVASDRAIEIYMVTMRASQPIIGLPDSARLWLGWGDWNLICTIPQNRLDAALKVASERGHSIVPIGRVVDGKAGVTLCGAYEKLPAPRIESERFAKDSWFTVGIDAYIDLLLSTPLPK